MADQTLARYVNELGLLTLLRTHGPASRAELSRKLSLTPPTVTRLVSELTERGLVEELSLSAPPPGAPREPGRPAIDIALNPAGAYFLGVEIGIGIVRIALLDLAANTVATRIRRPANTTPEATISLIVRELKALERDPRFTARIHSMGVTVPGLVQLDGFVVHLPILGWKNLNLKEMLHRSIPLHCLVENNANAAAFGSIYTQPTLPSICTIFLKLGTGCGGATIVNGRLLRGSVGTAGELGHIRLTMRGNRCSCGQVGCLESWVNVGAMHKAWRGTEAAAGSDLSNLPKELWRAWRGGDPAAQVAVESLTKHLSLGIVSLVNIFNPTTIMLGGIMKPLLECILLEISGRVAVGIVQGTRIPDILVSPFDEYECAIGAATLAHHQAFDISRVDITERDSLY